jgi:hypothetical protein
VADAGEQCAQSRQLLGLVQRLARDRELMLSLLAVGDVEMDAVDNVGGALRVPVGRPQRIDPADAAVIRPDDAIFDLQPVLREAVEIGLGDPLPIVGVEQVLERPSVDRGFGRKAHHRLRPVGIPARAVHHVESPRAELGTVNGELELSASLLELVAGAARRKKLGHHHPWTLK